MSLRFHLLLAASLTALLITLPSALEAQESQAETKPRFVDRGMYVEDTQTGLLWQKDGSASEKKNFYEAAEYAQSLKLGALTDWRVPTRDELQAIFPANEPPFTNTKYNANMCCSEGEFNSYWTCELDTRKEDYAYLYQWYAKGGPNNCYASKNQAFVRCVHNPAKLDPNGKLAVPAEVDVVQVKKLIAQLGDDEFVKRVDATKTLEMMGTKIRPLLKAALEETKDFEVKVRLQFILGSR